MKDMDYSYEYKDDDRYCYPGTKVLRNKLGITDSETLHDAERELSMARYDALQVNTLHGDYSLKHLQSIHRYLFQDIYEWAGEIRTVDIAKGTVFCLVPHIESQFSVIHGWLKKKNFLKDVTDKAELVKNLAYLLGEINMIHPFREGNGRSQRLYVEQLCANNGRFELNFSNATKEEMIKASVDASICNYEAMESIFSKCLIERK